MKKIQNKQKNLMKTKTCLWILKISTTNQKSETSIKCLLTLGKKTIGDLCVKNLWKIYRLAYGFCFFVISTSVLGNKKAATGLAKQNIVLLAKTKHKDLQIFHRTDHSKRL
jgi:hypothetical protein